MDWWHHGAGAPAAGRAELLLHPYLPEPRALAGERAKGGTQGADPQGSSVRKEPWQAGERTALHSRGNTDISNHSLAPH